MPSLLHRVGFFLTLMSFAACDSGANELCEPAAAVSSTPRNASVAVLDDAGCRVEAARAISGPWNVSYYAGDEFITTPTQRVEIYGPINDGPSLVLSTSGTTAPTPGRYPVFDLRGPDGRFGPRPLRFSSDSVYSFTSNGTGQGYWFATGGEVVVERSDARGVAGTFDVTYLHGGGGVPPVI